MVTRRQWFLQLGGGVVLAGWSGADLDAGELPAGLYEASREHLGHALGGQPVAVGGETELFQPRAATFRPAFFSGDEYQTIRCLTALMLEEPQEAGLVHEISEWIDLTLFDAAAVREEARALSPAHRAVAVAYYGRDDVRKLEEFDAQNVAREGLAWIEAQSRRRHDGSFLSRGKQMQVEILKAISDDRADRGTENAGTRFFTYLKERVMDGFYTSRQGLEELGYRGNAFYASPPGCEHLYG
jgi:Gluconate 2-dehydrogenase subunit 3